MEDQDFLRRKVGLGEAETVRPEDQNKKGQKACHCPDFVRTRYQWGPRIRWIKDDSGVKRLSEQVNIVMDIHCGRKGNDTAG
jgi:hypothetical protein